MESGGYAAKGNRIEWLDSLRTFMIFLVVVVHAGIVYEGSGFGILFWIVSDPSDIRFFEILNLVIDLFVMSAIFFVAGYLAPSSLEKKGGMAFLKSKFRRLMVPWMFAVLTLIPLFKVIFLASRNLPQERWASYFHWSNGVFSQSWLWFLPVLFMFDVLYLLVSRLNLNLSKITLRGAIGVFFLLGLAYSTTLDVLHGEGWTKTALVDFQNERLPVYFFVFLSGSLCFARKTFESKGHGKRLARVLAATVWIPVALYILWFRYEASHPGKDLFSGLLDSLLIKLLLLLSILGLLTVVINVFRLFLNTSGKIVKELNGNSYGVYIIHTIVLGVIAWALLQTALLIWAKYLLLTGSTYVACNLIVSFYRRFIKPRFIRNRSEGNIMKKATIGVLVLSFLAAAGCEKRENPAPRVSLHLAALQGRTDLVRQHIEAGTELNEKDEYGSTPLIIAITFGRTDAARALIGAGADMTITNNEGSSPLHIAAFFCRTEIVRALLDKGADKEAKNMSGSTPLDTVAGPFDEVRGIYDEIRKGLEPLGLGLDYEKIKATRPQIAEMLRGPALDTNLMD